MLNYQSSGPPTTSIYDLFEIYDPMTLGDTTPLSAKYSVGYATEHYLLLVVPKGASMPIGFPSGGVASPLA